jgi:hypothetical protein
MNAVDNSEVEWQRRLIPLAAISVDPAVQQRAAGTFQAVIDDYAEAMRDGVKFPPIDVFGSEDGAFHLADGFHRLEAYRSAHPEVEEIECNVHFGNRDDALLFACGANARHGLRRSRSDKLKAVVTLIRSETWSGGAIVRSLGNVRSHIDSSPQFAANMWKRFQMPHDRRKRPPRILPRTHLPSHRIDDARSCAVASVTTWIRRASGEAGPRRAGEKKPSLSRS